jgi:hypothetical protein
MKEKEDLWGQVVDLQKKVGELQVWTGCPKFKYSNPPFQKLANTPSPL